MKDLDQILVQGKSLRAILTNFQFLQNISIYQSLWCLTHITDITDMVNINVAWKYYLRVKHPLWPYVT